MLQSNNKINQTRNKSKLKLSVAGSYITTCRKWSYT